MNYKFYIDYGSGEVEIHPVDPSNLKLQYERPEGQEFYRLALIGELLLQDDSSNGYTDYTTLWANTGHVEIKLIIKSDCDNYASIKWQGYFSTFDGDWDADECYVVFKNIEPDDDYRDLLAYGDREYNIFDMADAFPVATPVEPEAMIEYFDGPTNLWDYPTDTETAQVIANYGVEWTFLGFNGDGSQWKWQRYKLTWQPSDLWVDGGDGYFYFGSAVEGYTLYAYYPNSRNFFELIKAVYDDIQGATSANLVSEFFTSSTNPVSLKPNKHSNLSLAQKSDLIGEVSDYATIGMITFSKLMDWLRDIYQVYWSIDSSGNLVLEHIDWYARGGSYTSSPSVSIDMTDASHSKYIVETKKFSYLRDEMPRAEKWNFMEAESEDFIGTEIEYPQIASTARGSDTKESHDLNSLTTDVPFIKAKPDKISSDGFVLMACKDIVSSYKNQAFTNFIPFGYDTFSYSLSGNNHTASVGKGASYYFQGMAQGGWTFRTGQVVRISYTLTLITGSAPQLLLVRGYNGDGLIISNREWMHNGSGVIDLIPTRDSDGSLYIANLWNEASNYSVVFTVELVSAELYQENGAISGELHDNAPLALANLHQDFWKYNRPFLIGKMNGVDDVIFVTLRRLKKQMIFFSPMCPSSGCTDTFFELDPTKLITTQMGNGKILKATLALGNDTVDFELIHDEENRLKSGLGIGGIGVMEIENDNIVG